MSETKKNKNSNTGTNRKKNKRQVTPAYRRLVIRYKIISTIFIVFMIALGVPNIFSHKRQYRSSGIELYEQGNYEEAVSEFQKSLDANQWFSDKVDVDVLMYQSSAFINMQDYTSAKAAYEKLLNDYSDKFYDRDDVSYLSGLCDTMLAYEDGKYSDSLEALKTACDSGYTELALCVAICYESIQNYDEMESYLDLYAQSNPMDAYVYCKYADLYIARNDYSSAVECIESALALNNMEYTQELSYMQILCYKGLGDYERAYELSEVYVASYPDDEGGLKLNTFLETRANPDTEVINDIFGVNPGNEDKTSAEILSVE